MIRTNFQKRKVMTRINRNLPVLDTKKVYYKFIDGAVRAIKIVDAGLVYKWSHRYRSDFVTQLIVRYKVAGMEEIQVWNGGEIHCGWTSMHASLTVADCINGNFVDVIPHYNTAPLTGIYGACYMWDGLKAKEVYCDRSECIINFTTGSETYMGLGVECYLTKQECENDNKVKVILFDDEENDNDREERMEYDKDLIKKMMYDFMDKYNVSELTLTIKKA